MTIVDPTPSDSRTGRDELSYQRRYFTGERRRMRIDGTTTPVVLRHLALAMEHLALRKGDHVVELGCGTGRFTRLLLERGLRVTAVDVSPDLVARLVGRLGAHPELQTRCSAAEDVASCIDEPVDAVAGFFFLHHLPVLGPALEASRRILRPGGRVAFCEPNGINPLYYAQVLLTPGMSFRGEAGLPLMRPGCVGRALHRTGFDDLRTDAYGFLPPRIALTGWGERIERWLEHPPALAGQRAYRLFSGRAR